MKVTTVAIIRKDMTNKISLEELEIPTDIFQDRTLSVLEALSEYLHESLNMTYHEIAVLLNRDDRTIWTCCNRARIKRKSANHSKNN